MKKKKLFKEELYMHEADKQIVQEIRLRRLDNPKGEPEVVLICQKGTDPWEIMQFAFNTSDEYSSHEKIVNFLRRVFLWKEPPFRFKKDHRIFGKFIAPPEDLNKGYIFPREVSQKEFEELKKDPRFR